MYLFQNQQQYTFIKLFCANILFLNSYSTIFSKKGLFLKNDDEVFFSWICLQAAEFLDIPDLFNLLNATTQDKLDPNPLILTKTISSLEDLCLVDGVFSDILFKLEDGTCAAHKAILTARSGIYLLLILNFTDFLFTKSYYLKKTKTDMMCAMFAHEEIFKEASARVIQFPGVQRLTFYQLLFYLYTGNFYYY